VPKIESVFKNLALPERFLIAKIMPYHVSKVEFDRLATSEGAKKTGDGKALIRCPAHNDGSPSCAIKHGGDGSLLVHCFAGCSFDAIIEGLKTQGTRFETSQEFKKNGDFRPKNKPLEPPKTDLVELAALSVKTPEKRDNVSGLGKQIRTHTYYDMAGNPTYVRVKHERGWTTQHYDKSGQIKPGMGNHEPSLFLQNHLKEAISEGQIIFIHEGEKDCDSTLQRSDGTVFATTSGGAQSWQPHFATFFKGAKKVILIGDEDDPNDHPKGATPGEQFAKAVIDSFFKAKIPICRYRLPRFFGGQKIKDVSDFYDAGGTFQQLKKVALHAHAMTPLEAQLPQLTIANIMERLVWPKEDERPVLDGIFEVGSVVQIVGASKSRKSFFALQLALSAALGERFLSWDVQIRRRVLYLNYELETRWLNARLGRMVEGLQADVGGIADSFLVADMERATPTIEAIKALSVAHKPEVMVIDPVYPLIQGNENDTDAWHKLLLELKNIARLQNCAVIYVHHDPKGDSSSRKLVDRGSGSSIQARHYDAGIYLGPHADPEATMLEFIVRNYKPVDAMTLRFNFGHFTVDDMTPAEPPKPNQEKKAPDAEEYVDLAVSIVEEEGPFRYGDLIERLREKTNIGKHRSHLVVSLLTRSGRVPVTKKGRTTIYGDPSIQF
jgi:hypothetical protein